MKAFYSRQEFPQLHFLESKWKEIKAELESVISNPVTGELNGSWFAAHPHYVEGQQTISWKTFEFIFFGIRNTQNEIACPLTAKLVSKIPELLTAQFSVLAPGTVVNPHKGFSKMVTRCHLPLIIPSSEQCQLGIEGEFRSWKEGELLIFNDALEHEAFNKSNELRAVLMFDIVNKEYDYSAKEICHYKLKNLDDPFLLEFGSNEDWLIWLEQGFFPPKLEKPD